MSAVKDVVRRAWDRRAALHATADLDCYRLLHGWTEGLPGVEVDRYGDTAVIEVRGDDEPGLPALIDALAAERAWASIVVRTRGGARIPARIVRGGAPGRIRVTEHGLTYLVEPGRAGNPGLYLDARPARAFIRAHAAGRRVFNLFAFTGSLGVAALAGGARSVLHMDIQAGALAWCRANHEANGQAIDDRSLARLNVYQHLRLAGAGRQRFGAILIDPPPGPEEARPADATPGDRGPLALVGRLATMLEPDGWLLLFLHHGVRAADDAEADAIAAAAAAGVTLASMWRGGSGDDFPEDDPARKLQLAALVRT